MSPSTAQIPTEILVRIFNYCDTGNWRPTQRILDKPGQQDDSRASLLLPILLTCRQWHELVSPLHYQRLSLSFDTPAQVAASSQLIQTLQKRPALFKYVRKLQLNFYHRQPPDVDIEVRMYVIRSVVWLLQNASSSITELHLSGGWDWQMDDQIYKEVICLPIKKLYIYEARSDVVFKYLTTGPPDRNLKHITFTFATDEAIFEGVGPQNDLARGHFLPTIAQFSANVKSLIIHGTKFMTIKDVEYICQWPQELEALTLMSFRYPYCDSHFARDSIERVIKHQFKSLKAIEIGTYIKLSSSDGLLSYVTHSLPDFSKYPQLENLCVSHYNLLSDSPEAAWSTLAAPNLQFLTVNLHVLRVAHSGPDQVQLRIDWFLSFASYQSKMQTISKLKQIHLDFRHETRQSGYQVGAAALSPALWPKEILSTLRSRFGACNILLTWQA